MPPTVEQSTELWLAFYQRFVFQFENATFFLRDFLEEPHCQLPERPNYENKIEINVVSGHFAKGGANRLGCFVCGKGSGASRGVVGWQDGSPGLSKSPRFAIIEFQFPVVAGTQNSLSTGPRTAMFAVAESK